MMTTNDFDRYLKEHDLVDDRGYVKGDIGFRLFFGHEPPKPLRKGIGDVKTAKIPREYDKSKPVR